MCLRLSSVLLPTPFSLFLSVSVCLSSSLLLLLTDTERRDKPFEVGRLGRVTVGGGTEGSEGV